MSLLSLPFKHECACGRLHRCPIEDVYIEKGALKRLPTLCQEYSRILLVADENTYKAAGERVATLLSEKCQSVLCFSAEVPLIPDERAISRTRALLAGVDLILGVGSGVIQDLCKYVSHFDNIPYMIVATAPSMDGYASDGAAMILCGMKKTVKATLPRAIIADTEVLAEAPIQMIVAGYGDIIGKYSALADWRLSALVTGEYFCPWIYGETLRAVERTRLCAKRLLSRDREAVGTLMEALVFVGVMMSYATSSRPASGSEHHLSHYFEISGLIENAPYFPHGIDVAYSTVITTKIREEILTRPLPDTPFSLSDEAYRRAIYNAYRNDDVAEGCIHLQKEANFYEVNRIPIYKAHMEEIRAIFRDFPTSGEIEKILDDVGLHMSDFFLQLGEEKIRKAILWGKDLKNRYTVLWMNYDTQETKDEY